MSILDLFRRKLTRDDFAAMVIRRAQALASPTSAKYDPGAFQIVFELDKGGPLTMNLHNAFRDASAVPHSQRQKVIDTYLSSLTGSHNDESPEAIIANLMPTVRDTAMFAWAALQGRLSGVDAADGAPCVRPFVGDLSVALVIDSEQSTKTTSQKALDTCGLTADAAYAKALENLRDRTDDAGMARHGGIWASTWHDVYDASRLLLTDMIHRLAVHGEPVVAIPSRNHLFVTGSLDDEGIAMMASVVADILESETRPLSEQLLILRDSAWTPFNAKLPAETAQRLTLARYKRLDGVHADQKALLEKIHEKEKVDVFVASYRAVQHTDTGRIVSSAQWTRDVRTLLPKSDQLLLLCSQRNELLDVAWADAAALIPALTEPQADLSPQRFLVSEFPDDAVYAALKEKAVSVRDMQPG